MSHFDLQREAQASQSAEVDVAEPVTGAPPLQAMRPASGLIAGGAPLRSPAAAGDASRRSAVELIRRAAALRAIRRSTAVADPLGGTEVSGDIESALASTRGGGRPLPTDVATSMGTAMGTDLSGVRVHDNAEANDLSRSVQAVAFTQGSDVYFSSGSYSPSTTSGQHLLAHELAHVAQNSSGSSSGGGVDRSVIGKADDPSEGAADRVADHTLAALRRTPSVSSVVHHPDGHDHGYGSGAGTISRVIRRKGKNKGKDVTVVAKQVAEHAYDNHHDEWPGDLSKAEFAQLASDMMMGGASDEKALSGGRTAYYHAGKNVLVIWNTARPDSSTCFRPNNGKTYYDGLT